MTTLLQKQANTIRFLCADMVQEANSGHPGAPMGLADIVTVLSDNIKHNPKDTKWLNRDRLVFSGGHASSMVYSLLHLWGYDITKEDLQNFRQLGSKTPGHPEYGIVPGVEITTGPLGQGVANAVGFALASKYAKTVLNDEKVSLIDHSVYCLCGDGDLQEGISYEACSLAGHQSLDNLIMIYDSNDITIEGNTNLAWSENVKERFEAQGWRVFRIDGHDFDQIQKALDGAKEAKKPSLIIARTTIAKGAVTMEGSHKSHGAPLGVDEIKQAKQKAGFNPEEKFIISDDVQEAFSAIQKGASEQEKWETIVKLNNKQELLNKYLFPNFDSIKWPNFDSKMATRASNGQILNAISQALPGFLGGSADLAPSNNTNLKDAGTFPNGKNIHFGIREHSMAAITNAFALYGLFIPFDATFFVFSDYLKPAVRVAALSNIKRYFIWTHDSIGVGEDGPTHQPVEQLSQFRAMPNLYTFRPADAVENVECWKVAIKENKPCAFVLSRQGLDIVTSNPILGDATKGGYLIKQATNPTLTLIASGSEVSLAYEVAKKLEEQGTKVNVVSVPCFELFDEQDETYKSSILNKNTKIIALEASRSYEWYKYADQFIGMETFGESGPGGEVFEHFGLSVEGVLKKIKTH
jgi:transketolase